MVVVSQWFHLPRAILVTPRFGMRQVSGDWPRWFEAKNVYSLMREAVAAPFYMIKQPNLTRQPDRVKTSTQ